MRAFPLASLSVKAGSLSVSCTGQLIPNGPSQSSLDLGAEGKFILAQVFGQEDELGVGV